MPPNGYCVYAALRGHPPIDPSVGCTTVTCGGPRSGRVMLSRPSMLGDLIRQSGELPAISRLRRLSRSLTFKGHPSVLLTSGLSLLYCPRLPPSIRRVTRCVLFSVPSASALAIGSYGHPWHHHHPRKSAPTHFGASSALSLRPSCLLAPGADRTQGALHPLGLLLPGPGHPDPECLPDITTTPN